MRLAFCFLSNRTTKIAKLVATFNYDLNAPPYIIESYTKNLMFNPPVKHNHHIQGWNCAWKAYYSAPTLDMFWMRQDSLNMAKHADIIYIGDDDMEIPYAASEVINQCCLFMYDNPDCGAIYLGGNFGGEGDFHKDEIYIANKGALGTNRGILVRNREVVLDDRFHALGAIFDCAVGFTCLMQGMYVARRLHVPIEHFTETRLAEDHPNLFYDLKFIQTRGIRSKISEVVGPWTDRVEWPKSIWDKYRHAAMVRGFIPKYDQEGNIFGG